MSYPKLAILQIYYGLVVLLTIIGCQKLPYEDDHELNPKLPDLPKCTCGLKPDEFNEFIERSDIGEFTGSVKAKFVQGTFKKDITVFCKHIWPRYYGYESCEESFTYDISYYPYSYYTLWIGKDVKIKDITQDEFNNKYASGIREIYSGNERGITYYNIDGALCYLLDTPYVVVEHKLDFVKTNQFFELVNKHLEKVKVCERHKHLYQEAWKKYNSENSSK